MQTAQRGDLVELNGLPCVIIALAGEFIGDEEIPEEHVALWYGDNEAKPTWEGGRKGVKTEVWTVPLEYVEPGQVPTVLH
jgi:hypothetical protein